MKIKVKDKFPLMESVSLVENELNRRGWNKARLVKESGISSRAATCFFQDGKINSENTFRILHIFYPLLGIPARKNLHICKIFLDNVLHL